MTKTQAPLGLFGDDVGRHNCLTMLVLGFADIGPKVDGLHVFYSHDALGDPRGVAHASVNQPPGSLDVNWAIVLHNKKKNMLSQQITKFIMVYQQEALKIPSP